MAVTRRLFIKSSGVALATFAAAPTFLKRTVLAQTAGAVGKDHPIIIAIFQRGAMDGISAVIPFGDKSYYSVRPNIAIPEPKSGNADAALDLDGYFALHPQLAPFKVPAHIQLTSEKLPRNASGRVGQVDGADARLADEGAGEQ